MRARVRARRLQHTRHGAFDMYSVSKSAVQARVRDNETGGERARERYRKRERERMY